MFGEDEEIRQLKKRLSVAGADMDIVKKWVKQLMSVKKQLPGVWGKYIECYEILKELACMMEAIKKMLCENKIWTKAEIRDLQEYAKEMKKIGTSYTHEFVVDKEDKEFNLIYVTIRRLVDKFDGTEENRILLLSEVENLEALIKEKLEREQPDSIALTVFYQTHKEEELESIPPEARLERILEVAEIEFYRPIYMQTAGVEEYAIPQLTALIQRVVEAK